MGTVLYVLAEMIRHLAILVQPVVPGAARSCSISSRCRSAARFRALPNPVLPGHALPKPGGHLSRALSKRRR